VEELQGVAEGGEEGVLACGRGEDGCEAGEGTVGAEEEKVELSEACRGGGRA